MKSSSRMWDNPKMSSGHAVSLVLSAMLEYFGKGKKTQVPIYIFGKFEFSQRVLEHFASYV